jgi:hypothetical protein
LNRSAFIDLIAYLASIALIGGGVAYKDPAIAFVVVGGIVLTTIVLARLPKGKE